jgi:hypothetical protein
MLRTLFWICVYVLSIGSLSIKVRYRDGLEIKLVGWPERIAAEKPDKPTPNTPK